MERQQRWILGSVSCGPELGRRRFLGVMAGTGAAAALAVMGCSSDDDEDALAPAGPDDDEATGFALRVATEAPASLVAGFGFDWGTSFNQHLAWGGLFARGSDRMPVPADAESIDVSPDGRTVTVMLRPDLKWSDGTPYGAEAYVYGFEQRLRNGNIFGPIFIAGMEEAIIDPLNVDLATIGIDAVDDTTLVFTLTDPVLPFEFWAAAVPAVWPLPKHAIDAAGGHEEFAATFPIVSNGPYVVTSATTGEIRYERNPNWSGPATNPDSIVATIVPSGVDSGQFTSFRAGDLDFGVVPFAELEAAQADASLRTTAVEWPQVWCLILNHAKAPFDQLEVRRALYAALDREAMSDGILSGMGVPAFGVLHPSMAAGFDPDGRPPFELGPEAARQYLAEAGFPGGEGFPEVTLLSYGTSLSDAVVQTVQQIWRDVLGVSITIRRLDPGTWFSQIVLGDQTEWGEIADGPWPSLYPDAFDVYPDMYDWGGLVFHHNWDRSDELTEQQQEALHANDSATRQTLLAAYDMAAMAEVPLIPVFFTNDLQVRAENLEGSFGTYGSEFQMIRYVARA